MAVEKVTQMVINVDLKCPCCYKKIKKTLCKFPQIRDQVYDEKANTVFITVVCCSPEKIRDKLRAKGGKVIKGIEIKEPAKPKGPEKKEPEKKEPGKPDKTKVVVIEKQKELEKPKDKPKESDKAEKPKSNGKGDKPKGNGAPPGETPAEKPKGAAQKAAEPPAKIVEQAAAAAKGPEPVPAQGVPSVFPYCGPTYEAYAAGPYYHGYGFPPPPPQPCYEGHYGYGYAHHGYGHAHGHGYGNGYGCGYGRGGNMTRSDAYFSEENPQACSIM